ncbi:MAG: NCS2 family permease [Acidobacteriota bacterium]|jgi:Permeases|nr:NCS2 family permease [Acidobacteriota bacterium]OQB57622.1 MAG: Guanine/hypoxanthine permease PbuO [Candidatus Aminicenantes bacterium ADurb.Bin147]HNQ80273.1 NCS2 family permease [Candidatus Aminicenantes bacterium]MDD8010411.1 NCS2 family permease [Acidobacteriota bacterium]MDD8029361.1 NCS2 family permease [Acidobacteriota bacterium]
MGLESVFSLKKRGTNVRTEIAAGITTFLTMCYIVFVNPAILAAAGVPFTAATTATAIGAAVVSILMGLVTNRPLALASGMGFNAMLAFSVIGFQQARVPWQVGMAVVLAEGIIILILVLSGLREAVMNAIPLNLKRGIGAGIGLFIAVLGLNQGGLIRPAPLTLVEIGDFSQKHVWVTLAGLLAIIFFSAMGRKSAILIGLGAAAMAALLFGLVEWPSSVIAPLDFSTFFAPFHVVGGKTALVQILTPTLLAAVFSLMLTDFFDTMGSVVAIADQAGFLEKDGRVPGIKGILAVDSLGAAFGGLFGSSSITTYIESAAGVAQGGRSGLMPIVAGLCFVAAAFFSPVIGMVGGGIAIPAGDHYAQFAKAGFTLPGADFLVYPITAGALIFVGFLMMRMVREIEWDRFDEAVPAFLILIGIPLTASISHGIGFGFIVFTLIKFVRGKIRDVHPLMIVVALAFAAFYILESI